MSRSMDERTMAAVWCEIFGLESVEPEENFFQLGGNSFLAVRIADRVSRASGVRLTFDALFEHQTIQDLCAHVRDLESGASPH